VVAAWARLRAGRPRCCLLKKAVEAARLATALLGFAEQGLLIPVEMSNARIAEVVRDDVASPQAAETKTE